MCLLGPSGCGKTTMLRMIAGLEWATSGDIMIAGKRVNDLPARERNVAMAFQFYALYPSLSVEENLAYPAARGKPEQGRDRRAHRQRQRGARPEVDSQAPPASARRGREAARRGRPLDRARSHLFSVRRAAEPPRHPVAPDDAHPDQGNARAARQADRDRHPRPDRGPDDGRPHRGDASRARSSRSPRRTICSPSRPICSSPVSSARRR